jgi:hypothetical protein
MAMEAKGMNGLQTWMQIEEVSTWGHIENEAKIGRTLRRKDKVKIWKRLLLRSEFRLDLKLPAAREARLV